MFSRTAKNSPRSAAWRISLWSSVAFAIGTAFAFWFLQGFLGHEIQSRADSWLTGELGVLADVAERTPADQLHDAVVDEVAELASREAPRDDTSADAVDRSVFFLQTTSQGLLKLHTGAGVGATDAHALKQSPVVPGKPATVSIPGFLVPFRVAEEHLKDGDRIYLALSTDYERRILHRLRVEFTILWCLIISLGTFLVFFSSRRTLRRVQLITETANSIGRTNLGSRIPSLGRDDEITRLSLTLNHMLDRLQASVEQLHAMSDALAHDLRSPMTSVRGKLELALMSADEDKREEAIVHCIEEVDRISSLLSTSLDVSEASADALRLRKEPVDLEHIFRSMVELHEPAFNQAGLNLCFENEGSVYILADVSLLQRAIANLLDNELKHLAPGRSVLVKLQHTHERVQISIEDDGAGFPSAVLPQIFERYVKGPTSGGHGLGLAFVSAVVRSHGGTVVVANKAAGGAILTIELSLQVAVKPIMSGIPA